MEIFQNWTDMELFPAGFYQIGLLTHRLESSCGLGAGNFVSNEGYPSGMLHSSFKNSSNNVMYGNG